MLETEWQKVWGVFCGLWPRQAAAMTSEEEASYMRVMVKHTESAVIEELRAIKETQKFVPLPYEIRVRLSESSRRNNNDVSYDNKSDETADEMIARLTRDRWAEQNPNKAGEIRAMTDKDVMAGYWCGLWNKAVERKMDGWCYWSRWQRTIRPDISTDELEDEFIGVMANFGRDWSIELKRRRLIDEQVRSEKGVVNNG